MAGGPIFPFSVFLGSASGNLFPNFYAGGGGNQAPHDEGIGVVASYAAAYVSGTAELRFAVPPSVPSGTMKLRDLCLVNATTGAAVWAVLCATVSGGGSPSAVTLTSQAMNNLSANANTADKYQEFKTTLTPPNAPAGNDVVVVAISMTGSGYTMAQTVTHIPSLIWE